MRHFYTLLFYLALPFILLRLVWRSLRQPAYRQRVGERLGIYPFHLEKCIWIHAVSMGETLAAVPLVKALKHHYPHIPILLTTMTITGAAQVVASFGNTVHHAFIPYDIPAAIKGFFKHMHPLVGIIIETELWPNLIAIAHQNGIPICVMNARLSEKSAKGYQRIRTLTQKMLEQIDMVAAQGHEDAERLIALGIAKEKIVVTGNIKFDLELDTDLSGKVKNLREWLGKERFIWIAASTHEGEEAIILAAHQQIRKQYKEALLILVPRHPNRFEIIAKLAAQSFNVAQRSRQETVNLETGVYVGDTMGELLLLYGVADVAFVGGSLISRGGHNMLEPAVLGKPILTGPHLFNFMEISALFFKEKALIEVTGEASLVSALQLLMQPTLRQEMGERAIKVMSANRGALAKQLDIIGRMINEVDSSKID